MTSVRGTLIILIKGGLPVRTPLHSLLALWRTDHYFQGDQSYCTGKDSEIEVFHNSVRVLELSDNVTFVWESKHNISPKYR